MEQTIDLLLIGGCADGERRTAPEGLCTFEMTPPPTLLGDRGAPALMHGPTEKHRYWIHKLHENGKMYHVAIWEGHGRAFIETLIDGYKR